MNDLLEKICADKRAHVRHASKAMPFKVIDGRARTMPPPRGFARTLRAKAERGAIGLIAEIKKVSPSAGLIRPDFDPAALAHAYEEGGAACLSVLTDTPFFEGRNEDLIAARAACTLPVLRKDFMLDVWQVAEARIMGADCILLIMAALDDGVAIALHQAVTGYDMDVLIEVHDEGELDRALLLAARDPASSLIGINNRNLKTLAVDLAATERLAPRVPEDYLLVGESGISTPSDIARLRAAGVHCFLVGESLLKQENVTGATRKLLTLPAL